MKKSLSSLFLLIALLISTNALQAQKVIEPKAKQSPFNITTLRVNDTYLKITYGQPYKRNREIFGSLVPYGKIWRTGANEATEITTNKDIVLGGKRIKAGTYTLFSIPEKDKWTIIINSDLGQWGAYQYDESKNVAIFDVPTERIDDTYEALTIVIEEAQGGARILVTWDQTLVRIPVTFN
ncbi:DUF2911 domain-containing protein [Eisenibacter elegans]|jgi:hypothetical protein|uniref:DUF2911 domain-containing protein n=1 Tax=Eisenibacter elegans TaxID=997 RepID=UPI000428D867|nr:DUF2911 domain-containing protein [Eisenibacter elegans]